MNSSKSNVATMEEERTRARREHVIRTEKQEAFRRGPVIFL
jgi:hypothetical protein